MNKVKHRRKVRSDRPLFEYLKVAAPYLGLLWNVLRDMLPVHHH